LKQLTFPTLNADRCLLIIVVVGLSFGVVDVGLSCEVVDVPLSFVVVVDVLHVIRSAFDDVSRVVDCPSDAPIVNEMRHKISRV
jgi:hypothetical protein